MKLSTTLLSIVFPSLAVCRSLSFFGNHQAVLDSDDLSVPGDNPLVYCQTPTDDILAIEHVDLDPNPPGAYVSHTPDFRNANRFRVHTLTSLETTEARL